MSATSHETAGPGVIAERIHEWLDSPGERATIVQLAGFVGASIEDTRKVVAAMSDNGQMVRDSPIGAETVVRWRLRDDSDRLGLRPAGRTVVL